MHGHMLPQSRMGGKPLLAHLAAEGTFTGVATRMDAQCLLVATTVAATLADEILLLRVDLDVVTHVSCGEEALLTARIIAGHIALVRVLQLVAFQLMARLVSPAANDTRCSTMHPYHMLVQQPQTRQLRIALQADERLTQIDIMIPLHVLSQSVLALVHLLAVFTFVLTRRQLRRIRIHIHIYLYINF